MGSGMAFFFQSHPILERRRLIRPLQWDDGGRRGVDESFSLPGRTEERKVVSRRHNRYGRTVGAGEVVFRF